MSIQQQIASRYQAIASNAQTPDEIKAAQADIMRGLNNGSLPSYVGVPLLQSLNQSMTTAQNAQTLAQAPAQQNQPAIAQQVIAQAEQPAGIAQAQSNLPSQGFAGGGIVAFADNQDQPVSSDMPTTQKNEEQAQADRQISKNVGYSLFAAPAALAGDLFAGPYNAAAKGITSAANAIGIPRAGRALGIYGSDINSVEMPTIGDSSLTPFSNAVAQAQDELRNPSAKTSTSTSGAQNTSKEDFGKFDPGVGDSWDNISIIHNKGKGKKEPAAPIAPTTPAPDTTVAQQPTGPSQAQSPIDAYMDKWDKMLSDSTKDSDKQKELAGWMALANLGLGWASGSAVDAQGHPVSAAQNLAKAGIPALQGYAKSINDIKQEERENLMQRMGLGIKGIQLGQSQQQLDRLAEQLGMSRQELQAKLPVYSAQAAEANARVPLYAAQAAYYRNRPTTGLGSVSNAVVQKELDAIEGYRANPKLAPFFTQLPADVQTALTKTAPTSDSYQRGMAEYDKYAKAYLQQRLGIMQAYGAKQRPTMVAGTEDLE